MSAIRKLFLHFGQFMSTGVLVLLLGFLTFPVLTRLLSREDYGILGLVTNSVAIAVAISKGGISDSIIRFYRDFSERADLLVQFVSTVLARSLLFSAIVVGCYLAILHPMLAALGIDARYHTCFLVMAAYLFARPVNILAMNFMRARGQVLLLNLTNLAIRVLEIAAGFALLLWIVGELYGYLLGVALVQVAATVFLLGWMLRHHSFALSQVSAPLTYKLLGFGIPLLLTELAYLLLSYADRFMIVAFNGQATLGAYTVGYNVPSYINDLVMFSLSYAIVPIYTELYGREGKAATEVFLSRAADYYLMIVLPICIGYAAISRDALVVLASTKYADAAGFSPLILLGLIFLGFNYILYAGLYLEKKTTQILAIMVVAVCINIAANLYLVPRYQAYGAAVATLIACIVATVLTATLGRRYLRVSPSLASFAYYLAASCAMYFIVTSIDLASSWLNLLAKISTGVVLMAIAAVARERDIRNVIVRRLRAAQGGPH